MTPPAILVLDEGTTSTRAMLFAADGSLLGTEQRELTQHYPQPGWVEHDAAEIWERTLACAQAMVETAGGAQAVAAIGITNQRETVVAWDAGTGEPLSRAIVWQDRRTEPFCRQLRDAGHEALVREKTGLLLDPYFSGTKMRWMLDNDEAVRGAADAGTLRFGTVESWLVFKLTAGAAHITDASNASRTMLYSLETGDWDEELLALLGVPRAALPQVVDCAGQLATASVLGSGIPICGMAGDQQAATIGQACLSPGETKATYGTGAFVLTNKGGEVPMSRHRLLGTVLCQLDGTRTYALEGSVFVAGSLVQWLRDSLGLIASAKETEALARSVDDSGGVVIVPALSGLGAPHWLADARASITGLSFATGKAQIVRAALEAMAHQTQDLRTAFAADGADWALLKVDGGMIANDWLAQDIADITGLQVERPGFVETTALGAAMLAAVGAGLHATLGDAASAMIGDRQVFSPAMDDAVRSARIENWDAALAKL
ncbi:glycerol kinase GlpK [Paraurantiacibacter namhicola]|uniref:ATP:glycerol 3-phosphotransferase n=1 Tax=Paraurantiacibacter namhicola TaxID=645517 RepID=A0A1C7DB61_9SPHN|nr:glycerol kinase GlpK [Paraurantiacibacter namhicola]ANU08740.1 Glycerol kinase [Paraurantiacibacter namhicola]